MVERFLNSALFTVVEPVQLPPEPPKVPIVAPDQLKVPIVPEQLKVLPVPDQPKMLMVPDQLKLVADKPV